MIGSEFTLYGTLTNLNLLLNIIKVFKKAAIILSLNTGNSSGTKYVSDHDIILKAASA